MIDQSNHDFKILEHINNFCFPKLYWFPVAQVCVREQGSGVQDQETILGSEVVIHIAGYALTGPAETCLLLEPVLCCAQESCAWAARQWGSPTRSISEISASLIGEAGKAPLPVHLLSKVTAWTQRCKPLAAGSAVGTVCPFHSLSVQLWTLPIVSW